MTGATPAKSASVFDHGFSLCDLSCSSRGCAAQKRQPANATLIGHFKGRVIRNVSHASPDGIPVATTATLPGPRGVTGFLPVDDAGATDWRRLAGLPARQDEEVGSKNVTTTRRPKRTHRGSSECAPAISDSLDGLDTLLLRCSRQTPLRRV